MKIRQANSNDKNLVLDFCQSTFSWGDYISDVWKYWITEGNLIVAEENNQPVAISHASIIKNQHVWIEGIRVHEKYRNLGIAKKMIQELESIGKQNNCKSSMMLIETNNTSSLNLAKSKKYKIIKKCNFYSILPKYSKNTNVKFVKNKNIVLHFLPSTRSFYVKSWRWIPLTESIISSLIKEKKIIYTEKNKKISGIGIFEKSEHFANTVLLTLILSDESNLEQLLIFFRNYALEMNWTRIQILCDLELNTIKNNLEKKYSFYLLEKNLD